MKNLKTLLLVALVPALLAAKELTGVEGFYNIAAFIIVGMTLLQVLLVSVVFVAIAKADLSKATMPEEPKKLMLMFSRAVSILTTIYLVFTGHWLIGTIDLINLGLSFLLLFLLKELRTQIDVEKILCAAKA